MLNLRTLGLVLGLLVITQSAYAADEVAVSPQRMELNALHEQAALESARFQLKADVEAREEQRELRRLKHAVEMARYQKLRDATSEHASTVEHHEGAVRDALMKRRLFLPELFGVGARIGGAPSGYTTGILAGSASSTEVSASESVTFAPSADIRVGERVTLGGVVAISQASYHVDGQPTQRATSVRIAPRIGYLIPLGSTLALWPKAQIEVATSEGFVGRGAAAGIGTELAAVLPLTSHIYFSVAPQFTYSLTDQSTNGLGHSFAFSVESRLGVAF